MLYYHGHYAYVSVKQSHRCTAVSWLSTVKLKSHTEIEKRRYLSVQRERETCIAPGTIGLGLASILVLLFIVEGGREPTLSLSLLYIIWRGVACESGRTRKAAADISD